jgi:outer membrane protein
MFVRPLIASALAILPAATLVAEDRTDAASSPWRVMLGGGASVRPEFPGADETEVLPRPAFNISYGQRWFLNNYGLGANLVVDDRWSLSTAIGVDLTRRQESDAAHLRGTGDVDRTAVAVMVGGYRINAVQALLSIATDIADEGHGTVADLTLQSRWQLSPRLSLDYGIAGRWVNDEYARTFFGVDAQQSTRSGLATYEAGSGFNDARAFVNALYSLTPQWLLSVGGAYGQLQGDAVDSPIVEDDRYFTLDAGVIYRF